MRLGVYYGLVRERLDDPIVRMVVAAGTSRDLREFWTAVAYILSLARRASYVAIDYSDRWGTGSVRLGTESAAGGQPHTEPWRDADDRFVRLALAPPPAGDEPLERELP